MNDIILEIGKKYIIRSYNSYFNNNSQLYIDKIDNDDLLDKYTLKINYKYSQPLINTDIIDLNVLKHIPGIKVKIIESRISLYQPLFSIDKNNTDIYTVPEGLNKGERSLVDDLCNYLGQCKLKSKYTFYLLRNGIKGKGVGIFVNNAWIYPDFILWMINEANNECKVIFLEPHGLSHSNFKEDPKINLYNYLKNQNIKELNNNSKYKQLSLDSFVISVTSYNYLKDINNDLETRELLANEKHIVFSKIDEEHNNYGYVEEIFSLITN